SSFSFLTHPTLPQNATSRQCPSSTRSFATLFAWRRLRSSSSLKATWAPSTTCRWPGTMNPMLMPAITTRAN
ncbi:unnamed protein product, partial [Aphanomyces euteiches]